MLRRVSVECSVRSVQFVPFSAFHGEYDFPRERIVLLNEKKADLRRHPLLGRHRFCNLCDVDDFIVDPLPALTGNRFWVPQLGKIFGDLRPFLAFSVYTSANLSL